MVLGDKAWKAFCRTAAQNGMQGSCRSPGKRTKNKIPPTSNMEPQRHRIAGFAFAT